MSVWEECRGEWRYTVHVRAGKSGGSACECAGAPLAGLEVRVVL